ncbi:AI-2E family transporter [Lachnospiraceae bacterium 62-35]
MRLDKEQLKKIRGLILFTVLVTAAAFHYKEILAVLGRILHMLMPFLLGGGIAFILNVPMRRIEGGLTGKGKSKKWHRPASLLITLILVAGILAVVFFVAAPEFANTIMGLRVSVPVFAEQLINRLTDIFVRYPDIVTYLNNLVIDWNGVFNHVLGFLKSGAGPILNTTFAAAASIVNGMTSFGIGFVFAVYILLQKEILAEQLKKCLQAFLPEHMMKMVLETAVLTEKTFSNFLAGQCLEAVILGTMFFISMSLLDMPYALLMGVLIGFTALIPIFGAFIGCGVGMFLMLMISPMNAMAFFLLFNVLQQIEGNLIYPHVVGGSVGLPSIWVLAAVTLGGSLMGIVGMLVFIPICSVLYSLLRREVNRRVEEKSRKPSAS